MPVLCRGLSVHCALCRNGGAIFQGMCADVGSGNCFWVGLPVSTAATMILLQRNVAQGKYFLIRDPTLIC